MEWVNEKDFHKLPVFDKIACNQALIWKRREVIKDIIRREEDGSYSVLVDR